MMIQFQAPSLFSVFFVVFVLCFQVFRCNVLVACCFQVAWPARAVLFICLAGFPWLPLSAYSAPSFADLPAYLPAAGTALIFRSYLPSSRRCGDDDGDDDYDGDYAIGFLLETQHSQSYNLCSEW